MSKRNAVAVYHSPLFSFLVALKPVMTPTESLDFPHQPRTILLAIWVGARICVHLLYGTLLAAFYPKLSRTKQQAILRQWSGQLLDILHLTRHGATPEIDVRQGLFVVANHVSWLDIFVLNAVLPMRFIAKDEVRNWWLIGWLCQRSGTLFIKRATRQHLVELNQSVADLLQQQEIIGAFPEGTTSEGCQVSTFYPALFQGAVDAAAPILPVCLYYHDPQGKHSQLAAYTGEMSLIASIWRILRCHDLHVSLSFSSPLPPTTRRTLATSAHSTISQQLQTTARTAQQQGTSINLPLAFLSEHSAYALLLAPVIDHFSQ